MDKAELFKRKFENLDLVASQVICRLSDDRQVQQSIVDILHAVVRSKLDVAADSFANAELSAASIHMQELSHDGAEHVLVDGAEQVLAVLDGLADQIICLAKEFNSRCAEFYCSQVDADAVVSGVSRVIIVAVEHFHGETCANILWRSKCQREWDRQGKNKHIAVVSWVWTMYLAFSALQTYLACRPTCGLVNYAVGFVPALGGIFNMIKSWKLGFGAGLGSVAISLLCAVVILVLINESSEYRK